MLLTPSPEQRGTDSKAPIFSMLPPLNVAFSMLPSMLPPPSTLKAVWLKARILCAIRPYTKRRHPAPKFPKVEANNGRRRRGRGRRRRRGRGRRRRGRGRRRRRRGRGRQRRNAVVHVHVDESVVHTVVVMSFGIPVIKWIHDSAIPKIGRQHSVECTDVLCVFHTHLTTRKSTLSRPRSQRRLMQHGQFVTQSHRLNIVCAVYIVQKLRLRSPEVNGCSAVRPSPCMANLRHALEVQKVCTFPRRFQVGAPASRAAW